MKGKKKIPAILLVVALVVTSICNVNCRIVANAATKPVKVNNGMYTITSEAKKEARFDKVSKKSVTSLTIPATVKIGNVSYKVVSIKANALKNNKKLKTLTIGENVRKIEKKSFYKCNLKSIIIKTKVLKSVGSNAFGKINSKAVAIIPRMTEEKEREYAISLLGVKGRFLEKNQVIKVKNLDGIPKPEVNFAIGEPSGENYASRGDAYDFQRLWVNTTNNSNISTGEFIPLSLSIKLPHEIYGFWSVKRMRVKTREVRCICKKYFDATTDNLAVHIGQTGHGAIAYSQHLVQGKVTMPMWYWTPDNTPCSVSYHITLPDGFTCTDEDIANQLKVYLLNGIGSHEKISDKYYRVVTNGQNIEIQIDDIKTDIFYPLEGVVKPVVVTFNAKLNDSAADVNQINADISYSFGTKNKTINMSPVTVRKK